MFRPSHMQLPCPICRRKISILVDDEFFEVTDAPCKHLSEIYSHDAAIWQMIEDRKIDAAERTYGNRD